MNTEGQSKDEGEEEGMGRGGEEGESDSGSPWRNVVQPRSPQTRQSQLQYMCQHLLSSLSCMSAQQ